MLEPMRLRRCGRLAVHTAKRNYDMGSQEILRNIPDSFGKPSIYPSTPPIPAAFPSRYAGRATG